MDSARALIARGWGVSLVSRCLRVSRAQLYVILRRTDDWMDGRRSRHTDDTDVLLRIHHVIGELPTYGYRRVWALLRRQAELDGMPAINAKRVYRIMRQNALLLERKPTVPPSKRAHTGRVAVKESNQRWCSDGFEFCCDNGERLRVTFALDCCDREALHWAVTTGGFNSETVQDVMLGAVERRFGNDLPSSPVEWLTDNGSCYRANETRQFARMLGLEPKNTAVRSPESNRIAESFVKTIKRDYISIMPKPDGLTAAKNLAEAFEHYNEWHPHSALGYRSPREYLRQRACNGLSDNRCLEIWGQIQSLQMLGLEPKSTAVRSPESNGIAESFVKTIKRDYISVMPKPDGLTAAKNLAEAFEHYNEWHPHSALGYRSPREYLRQQASNGLSDNRCLEI